MEFGQEVRIVSDQALHPPPQILVGPPARRHRRQIQPCQQSAGISVHDKHRPPQGIEQDAIRGLRPDAVERQQPFPQRVGGDLPQASQAAGPDPPASEDLQPAGFLTKTAGGSNRSLQRGLACRRQAARIQEAAPAHGLDGPRRTGPARILNQDGADTDLERSPARPPVPPVIDAGQRAGQPTQAGSIQPLQFRSQPRRFLTRVGRVLELGRVGGFGCPPASHRLATSDALRSRK